MTKEVDFIIVGHGLAGAVLSHVCINNNKAVHVFDEYEENSSSRVAAGLYNPITGRKMVKTWNADNLFSEIEPFYSNVEKHIGKQILHPIRIYRPFLTISEQNEWGGKSVSSEFSPYIRGLHTSSQYETVIDDLGGIELYKSGYLDIPSFIDAHIDFLKKRHSFTSERFEVSEMEFQSGKILYRGITARKVVFCTGIKNNQYFSFLPFRPVKGEILELRRRDLNLNHIVNRGVFVVPKGKGFFRVGSTYNWKDLSNDFTIEGKAQLINKLSQLVKGNFEFVSGLAGIRPATADRKPFIGIHPEYQLLAIFNGLGTKGVSLAPYYAKQLFKMLEFGIDLNAEVDIRRYYS